MSEYSEDIKKVLAAMDHGADANWTDSGLPKVEYVRNILGQQSITRDHITEAAPNWTRMTPDQRAELAKKISDAANPVDAQKQELDTRFVTKQVFAKPVPTIEQIQECKDAKEDLDRQIVELDGKVAQLRNDREQLNLKRDRCIIYLAGTQEVEFSTTLRRYLDHQVKQAHSEKGAREEYRKLTGQTKFASQLDASMARRTGYGIGRKPFPTFVN